MARLFHYHFWTPKVEEMEQFYRQWEFRLKQRVGREDGVWQTFDPPLAWDDLRGRDIYFRIIEMIRGNVNVTFGMGKTDQFDHVGFIVNRDEKKEIVQKAVQLNWKAMDNGKRLFVHTPWKFRIELIDNPAIDPNTFFSIREMEWGLPYDEESLRQFAAILGCSVKRERGKAALSDGNWTWILHQSASVRLKTIRFASSTSFTARDPVGVCLETIIKPEKGN
jgi:hypothetical protein